MSVDTIQEIQSSIHLALPWLRTLPLPSDGSIDKDDLTQLAGFYVGIDVGTTTVCIFTEQIGGIFAITGNPTTKNLAFARAFQIQNVYGEVVVSFVSTATFAVDLQPVNGTFPRYVHGDVKQANAVGIIFGNADIEIGDRTQVDGDYMEIIDIDKYGNVHTEVRMRWVGRP